MLYETDTSRTIVCSNATGPVYKVFRSVSSPYPLDSSNTLTTRPVFHFDAALFDGLDAANNPADGTTITDAVKWKCRATGGRYEAFQATLANQPTFETGGINGVPYVQLSNASNHYLDISTVAVCEDDLTVFGITGPCPGARCTLIGDGASLGNRGVSDFIFGYGTGTEWYFYGDGQSSGTPPINYSTAGAHPVFYIRDSGVTTTYGDGDNSGSNTGTNDRPMFLCQIGGNPTYGHDGPMYEVAVWDSVLSDADLNALGAYAIAKYGASDTTFDPTF